ncbi:MAG: hypothetical protein HOO06_09870 [Bdellovibrionaceae bacterium]|jgi:hypothetical protein|nr:hypothetical protein [Pseudobdellovibrionaceae bacterium]
MRKKIILMSIIISNFLWPSFGYSNIAINGEYKDELNYNGSKPKMRFTQIDDIINIFDIQSDGSEFSYELDLSKRKNTYEGATLDAIRASNPFLGRILKKVEIKYAKFEGQELTGKMYVDFGYTSDFGEFTMSVKSEFKINFNIINNDNWDNELNKRIPTAYVHAKVNYFKKAQLLEFNITRLKRDSKTSGLQVASDTLGLLFDFVIAMAGSGEGSNDNYYKKVK